MNDPLEDVEALATRYQLVVARSGRGHYIAAERMDRRGRGLGTVSAVLGAVVGTSIFATLGASPSTGWKVAAGLASTSAAVLVALATFLNYADRAAKHRVAGAAYGKLRREFDQFFLDIRDPPSRTEVLTQVSRLRSRIDELGEASPLIPKGAYGSALQEVGRGGDPASSA
jgi:hypothetical protein